MPNKQGDSSLALQPADSQPSSTEQQALSQHVQSLAGDGKQSQNPPEQAAPTSKWDKFKDTTEEGFKAFPVGLLHAVENPAELLKNAGISIATGAIAKVLLPETGPLGKVAAIGLGAYFAEQSAVPIIHAYSTGLNAKTMGDIHTAGSQLGDATASLAVNAPIGILGYKIGAGFGDSIMSSEKMSGFKTAKENALAPINDSLSNTLNLASTKLGSLRSGIFDFLNKSDKTSSDSAPLKGRVEATPDKPVGFDVTHMDLNTKPGDDFNRYANGRWEDGAKIPPDQNQAGTFMDMIDRSNKSVHDIVETAAADKTAAPGSNQQKIGDFYASGMNTEAIEAAGAKPIQGDLAKTQAITNLTDASSVLADMHSKGTSGLFSFSGQLDPGDSTTMMGTLGQGGLSMPRDFYVNSDAGSVKLRAGLQDHVQKMFGLLGDDQATAATKAAQVMNVESKLANITVPDEDMRDPISTYNKMSLTDLQKLTPNFDWNTYLKGMNADHISEVNVQSPAYFKAQSDLLGSLPLDDLKTYMQFHQLKDAAPYLSSDLAGENFNFFGKQLKGTEEQSPRWQQVVDSVNDGIPEAVGEKYVERNFSPEAKAKMIDMVGKLKDSMRDALTQATWMSDETRAAALTKINNMGVKIGYPDKWKDYSSLPISKDSYFDNVQNASRFAVADNISSIGKPVDRSVWGMSPQTVNAYYDPSMNEVVFPAAILQPPAFDLNADWATNLGSTGATIGHEISHGFDDQGSQYDEHGNLKKWWTDADFEQFMKKIQQIRDQYDQYTIPSGAHVKGENVSGEAAADLGGANIAYATLKKIYGDQTHVVDESGYSPAQRFFVAFAQSFSTKYRPEALEAQVAGNEHPPDFVRVNGTVGNMKAFENAFNVPDNAPVMVPPDKRTALWETDSN